MFLVGVMKSYFGSFLDNGKRIGVTASHYILVPSAYKITIAINSGVITKAKDLRACRHAHMLSKMRMKAFRLGVLSSSTYSSEAPNYAIQNQLKEGCNIKKN